MLQTHVIDRLVGELAPQQQASFREQYDALRNLPASGTDLQSFLGEFIRGVAGLYAASAAAIWFRNPDGNQLERKADVGYQAISLEDELLPAHDALLDFGMRQKAPLLVKPFSAPHSAAVVSNPTDSFVVLGPVIHHGDAIALIELFLGPVPLRGQTATVREQYVEWLAHLISFLCDGIERRYLASGKPLEAAMSLLDQVQVQVQRYQEEIRTSIEQSLRGLAGQNFGTIVANQAVAKRVHHMLESKGLRVRCPECGTPAILRCQAAGNSKTGVFLYDHYLETGRTFHGGRTTFPQVTVVAKPPRARDRPDGGLLGRHLATMWNTGRNVP